jgi:hypothetical protein
VLDSLARLSETSADVPSLSRTRNARDRTVVLIPFLHSSHLPLFLEAFASIRTLAPHIVPAVVTPRESLQVLLSELVGIEAFVHFSLVLQVPPTTSSLPQALSDHIAEWVFVESIFAVVTMCGFGALVMVDPVAPWRTDELIAMWRAAPSTGADIVLSRSELLGGGFHMYLRPGARSREFVAAWSAGPRTVDATEFARHWLHQRGDSEPSGMPGGGDGNATGIK